MSSFLEAHLHRPIRIKSSYICSCNSPRFFSITAIHHPPFTDLSTNYRATFSRQFMGAGSVNAQKPLYTYSICPYVFFNISSGAYNPLKPFNVCRLD